MYSFVDAFPIGKGVLPLDVTCDVFPAETFKATKFQQWEIFVSSCVSIFSLPEEHDAFQVELLHFLNCPLKPTCFGQSACLLLLTFLGLKKALIEVKASVVCLGKSLHGILSVFDKPLRHENIQSGVVLNGMIMNSYIPT